jgi:protein-tyrosine-phosphatase
MGAERDLRPSAKIKLLFVCPTHSILSPMADGLARADYTRLNIAVQSAGLSAQPLDAAAISVMAEIGIDIGDIVPTSVRDLDLDSFDIVVSLGMHKLGIGRHQMAIAWDIPKFQRLRQPGASAKLSQVRNALSARIRGLGAVLTATSRA